MTSIPLCDAVKVGENDILGRYLYSNKAFKCGDVIFSEKPISMMTNASQSRCGDEDCLKLNQQGSNMCSKCHVVQYCNRVCQKKHWKSTHRRECAMFVAIGEKYPKILETLKLNPSGIGLIRIYLRFLSPSDGVEFESSDVYKQYITLQDHHKKDTDDMRRDLITFSKYIMTTLKHHPTPDQNIKNSTDVQMIITYVYECHRALSRWRTNAFQIIDEDTQTEIASALYPYSSLIEHSCIPNCIQLFKASKMSIACLFDIQPGEHITIAYVGGKLSAESIRSKLSSVYHFTCTCAICIDAAPAAQVAAQARRNKHRHEMNLRFTCIHNNIPFRI
jgi:hypothetical protein